MRSAKQNMNYYQQYVSLAKIHACKVIINGNNHKPLYCENSTLQDPLF